MNNTVPSHFLLSLVQLDQSSDVSLYRQMYSAIRQAILNGHLAAGVRLPSTRDLAELLDVSRTTVVTAFDQLVAEGYLETRIGAGTFVTESLPDDLLYVSASQSLEEKPATTDTALKERGQRFAHMYTPGSGTGRSSPDNAFMLNMPDLSAFPIDVWARLSNKRYKTLTPEMLDYGRRQTSEQLRQAIADYLNAARGVYCEPEQVIVVAGSQAALFLAAHVLLDPGDPIWVEEPGYLGAKGAFYGASASIVPVPVDDAGMDVKAGIARAPDARVAYVTPSHQFPLGYTMSLARRSRLLQWAHEAGGWIIEDDYDSEYRYSGRPLASLHGLDAGSRVIYVGTFSKVLFPALRIGYIVAPPALVDAFMGARMISAHRPPMITEAVLADFIAEGHFTRHIRRMRSRYAERNEVFVTAAQQHLVGLLELGPHDAGIHVVGWLPEHVDDYAAVRRAAAHAVDATPLSLFHLDEPQRGGLLLGYAAVSPEDICAGVERLAAALEFVA